MTNNKIKILIVEDEKNLLDVLQIKLIKEGFLVEIATDGEEGLEKIRNFKPNLILLDIVMPKIDGYGVLEKMKKEKIKIPVIVISNSGQPVEVEKTTELGAVDHLIKTEFSPADVMGVVEKYFNLKNKKEPNLTPIIKLKKKEDKNVKSRNIKTLLVEDDSFLRELFSKKLTKEGFTVYEAIDGEIALGGIDDVKPDIVLLDIVLPSLDGFQVLEKIKNNPDPEIAKIPVVILSNLGQAEDEKKAKRLGATDYFIKAHFSTDEIVKEIIKIIEQNK